MPTETFNLAPITVGDKTVSAVVTVETSEAPPPPPSGGGTTIIAGPDRLPLLAYNSATLVDISAGAAWDGLGAVRMTCAAMTKDLAAAWAPGTGNGGRYSGSALADGTYGWYAACKAGGADQDYYAHPTDTDAAVLTDLQAETGGVDYVAVRYLGSVIRKGGAILPFDQLDDEFLLRTFQHDHNANNIGLTATLITTTVPVGRKVVGKYRASANHASGWSILFSSPDETDQAPTLMGPATMGSSAAGVRANMAFDVRTNTNGQIRARSTTASTDMDLFTYGWSDPALSGRYP